MVSFTSIVAVLSLSISALALPQSENSLAVRQIPANYLYRVEEFPAGCGSTDGALIFDGLQETLAACSTPGAFDVPPSQVSMKFTFPDDGVKYMWKIFSENNCGNQIAIGEGSVCTNVPVGMTVGAFIVYT